jgi:hypothetical protein
MGGLLWVNLRRRSTATVLPVCLQQPTWLGSPEFARIFRLIGTLTIENIAAETAISWPRRTFRADA